MWQVNLGNAILYYPANDDFAIFDTNLNEEVGLAGEFTFKVPPTNPLYTSLTMGALVTVLRDGDEYWRGEIYDIHTDFQKVAEVYCIEDLAWLGDEYMDPVSVKNQTYAQRFQTAIANYNANRPAERQFTAGYITNVSGTCNWTTEYEWSILDSLRNCICKDDGYIRIRRVTSGSTVTRYVDIIRLQDYGAALQPILFGYNLLDFVKESDYGNLTNILTPYGDPLKDASDNPVYVYGDYEQRLQGNTIQNSASINMYGRHEKSVIFDGVTNATTLNNLASAYLSRYCQPQLTMEVKAVDLADIENVDSINLGNSVQIIAEPFGIDQNLYLTQLQRDLQDVSKNTLTLSGHVQRKSLTSQIQKTEEKIEDLPTESSILEAAKKNALQMLLDDTKGGYVVFEYDSNNKLNAINICNYPTIARSTKRWRWSQTGFGFMTRDSYGTDTNPAWTGLPVAIDMAGRIVADAITTGTLSADRIKGGSLQLGGSAEGAYKNGALYIYNTSNVCIGAWTRSGITLYDGNGTASSNVIGTWTVSGINIKKGQININDKFIVNTAGTVTASDLNITGGSIKLTKQNIGDANDGLFLGTTGIALGKNSVFKVDNTGALTAKSGTVGGFTIDANTIRSLETSSVAEGAITLSTKDFTRNILGTNRSLRFAIGSQLGIDKKGKVYASGVEITGTLTSTDGKIGNFVIGNNIISTQSNTSSTADGSVTLASANFTRYINNANRTNLRFAIGSKFGIASDGTVYATNGVFKGSLTSTDALIGNFTIDSNYIRTAGTTSTANGSVCIGSSNFTRYLLGANRSNLRIAVGSRFGIDEQGNIYASGGTFAGTVSGGNININSGRFSVSTAGRVSIVTQGTSSEEDYLVIKDPGGNTTYIGGEYIYSTGAAVSMRIADIINYIHTH